MASADVRDELLCSICLGLYTDPVTLRCGHNFCRVCIDQVLNTQDGSGVYSCPDCRAEFQERPNLQRNVTLHNVAERLLSTQPHQEEITGIRCTYCIHSPVPAVMSCLHCEASLCDDHLRVHSTSAEHVLTDPRTSLENRKCPVHKKILEYYCTEDKACICVYCSAGEHRGHRVEMLDEASEKKKKKLRNVLQKLITKREKTEERVQSLEEHWRKAQEKAAGEAVRVTALFIDIRRRLDDLEKKVLSEISRREEQVSLSLSDVIQKLEIKKDELSWKMRDIEELCNMTDPLTVLQEPDTGDLCDPEEEGEGDEDTGGNDKGDEDFGDDENTGGLKGGDDDTGEDDRDDDTGGYDDGGDQDTGALNVGDEVTREDDGGDEVTGGHDKSDEDRGGLYGGDEVTGRHGGDEDTGGLYRGHEGNGGLYGGDEDTGGLYRGHEGNGGLYGGDEDTGGHAGGDEDIKGHDGGHEDTGDLCDPEEEGGDEDTGGHAGGDEDIKGHDRGHEDTGDLCDPEEERGDGDDHRVECIFDKLHTLFDIIRGVNVTFYVQNPEDLLLDLNTADDYILILDNVKTATWTNIKQNRPETAERFKDNFQVMSRSGFSSGRHYWDVEIRGSLLWMVGMCYPSIDRSGDQSDIGDNKKSWGLYGGQGCNNQCLVVHDCEEIWLPHQITSDRFRIYVDYEAGQLSFFQLCDPIRHLHTFTTTFSEPLHAVLCVCDGSIKILGGNSSSEEPSSSRRLEIGERS